MMSPYTTTRTCFLALMLISHAAMHVSSFTNHLVRIHTSSTSSTSSASSRSWMTTSNWSFGDDLPPPKINEVIKGTPEYESSAANADSKFLERNGKWIVLVDDEDAIRIAVGDFLYDSGYQVTACADAEALLDVCQNTNDAVPDIIISDVRMPGGKDGIELVQILRADDRLSIVPVVMLTAKGMTKDRVAGYKAGADVYLTKPFDPSELLSIVDNTIRRRKQMAGGSESNLRDLKFDLANLKEIMKKNSESVVKKTNVVLDDNERTILGLLCEGYTGVEIAKMQGSSTAKVTRAIQKMYASTETKSRTELVRWAVTTGYVTS